MNNLDEFYTSVWSWTLSTVQSYVHSYLRESSGDAVSLHTASTFLLILQSIREYYVESELVASCSILLSCLGTMFWSNDVTEKLD